MILPQPKLDSQFSLEKAVRARRSVRGYGGDSLTLEEAGQLLWAAQGVTGASGERSAPSAGATYPLDVYLAAGSVAGLPPGIYKYGQGHDITLITEGDQRQALSKAALGQSHVAEAPATLIITATYERTTQRYGDRGVRYVHMEAGHAAQNVCLQATAMGLGTVVIGAFEAESINHLLWLLPSAKPIYLISAGRIPQES